MKVLFFNLFTGQVDLFFVVAGLSVTNIIIPLFIIPSFFLIHQFLNMF